MNEKQLEIIQTVTAMFDAAPGERYLSEFVAFTTNTGSSVKTLASLLAATDVFKQSAYPDALPDNEFAVQFIDNTVGSLVTAENKAWATSEIENMLNAGQSRGEVIHWAATALASVDTDDAHWGAAARQFNNKVEVAAFYSVDQGGSATSLAVLQQVIANVTDETATVASAKALLESGATGKVIDGYVKGATVFADLNGDGVHNEDEPSTTTDAFGNFTLPGVTGFGNLIVSGGTDIATGKPFEGMMTAPAGSTVINPLTTLIDKIMQDSATTAAEATAKVLTSLGLNTGVDLLNFDPIQETIRTDTNATATGIALAVHAAAVKINTLISQAAALLSGVGVSANETAGIDLAYEALASSLANTTSAVDLASSSMIAQVIQDATVNSWRRYCTVIQSRRCHTRCFENHLQSEPSHLGCHHRQRNE